MEFSPADGFPLASYAPYKQSDHRWNLPGNGLSQQRFDIPVFLVENGTILDAALHGAQHNSEQVRLAMKSHEARSHMLLAVQAAIPRV